MYGLGVHATLTLKLGTLGSMYLVVQEMQDLYIRTTGLWSTRIFILPIYFLCFSLIFFSLLLLLFDVSSLRYLFSSMCLLFDACSLHCLLSSTLHVFDASSLRCFYSLMLLLFNPSSLHCFF